MKIEVDPDDDTVARKAAAVIAADMRSAVTARGRYVMAVSGGHTPWLMLRAWPTSRFLGSRCTSFRGTNGSRPPTTLTQPRAFACEPAYVRAAAPDHIHAMPVEATDLHRAAAQYASTLRDVAGSPPVLDLVHLGLGPDGHTASLVPGEPALDVADADVAVAGPYQGRRRMTLTFPIINRSRLVLWLVTGAEKTAALVRLHDGDRSIPAARVRRDRALMLADRAATERLDANGNQEAQK